MNKLKVGDAVNFKDNKLFTGIVRKTNVQDNDGYTVELKVITMFDCCEGKHILVNPADVELKN